MFFALLGTCWLLLYAAACYLDGRARKIISWLAPACAVVALLYLGGSMQPWQRLICTTFGLLFVVKAVVLLRQPRDSVKQLSPAGLFAYMTIWPGMSPQAFTARTECQEDGIRFSRGWIFAMAGCVLVLLIAVCAPALGALAIGWLGIIAILSIVHFGYADVLTSLMRLAGWNVSPLFDQPLKSSSLQDFWSKRWNLAFVEMDKILFFKPLSARLGAGFAVFGVFVISGLLHDLCISYSAGGGWGLPTLYFLINGAAVLAERKLFKGNMGTLAGRVWTWSWLLVPLPLLFTHQFRQAFIVPLFSNLHAAIAAHPLEWYISLALWLGALGHFLTLGAGLQVPYRLKWKEELAKISTFNRKIFLTYAAYTGLAIVTLGTLSLLLHNEILHGDKAALYLSVVIGCFWGLRVLIDYFSFGHKDWPEGPMFVIGHTCLTTLFVFLTVTFLGTAAWHIFLH
jgi:alginate O-acetyltransferase complex protein AlgI